MASGGSYGTVTINGQTFVEREQTFPLEITMTSSIGTSPNYTKGSLVLPGVADFWLKALVRDTLASNASAAKRFKFRLGNSDGAVWYQNGGSGGSTDRVLDTNLFGSGQFPRVICPYIYYSASANIQYEIEDLSNSFPYTIYFAFVGSYLIPTGG